MRNMKKISKKGTETDYDNCQNDYDTMHIVSFKLNSSKVPCTVYVKDRDKSL